MKIERFEVQPGQVPVYYEVAGSGDPIVLIHGLSASGKWWARNVGALAERFRVYVVDLVGFGRSRGRGSFVLSQTAGILACWMDQVGLERASLVGHSMGGFIALDLAAGFPDRVDRLVLVDAALPRGRGYERHGLGLARGLTRLPLSFLPTLFADAWRTGPVTIWKAARELLTSDVRPKLAQVRAPVLLVWGERDWIVPAEIGRRLSEHLSNADLVVLDGAGHNAMWDCPEAFNRVVLEFLGQERDEG